MTKRVKFKYLISIVLVASFISFLGLTSCDFNSIEFNQDEWKQNPEIRYRMVKSLFENYELTGLTRDELIELLGPPIPITPSTYYIGSKRSWDAQLLHFYFKDGLVTNYRFDVS